MLRDGLCNVKAIVDAYIKNRRSTARALIGARKLLTLLDICPARKDEILDCLTFHELVTYPACHVWSSFLPASRDLNRSNRG